MGVAPIATQVFQRIDLHQGGDERHDEEHHNGEPINVLANGELHSTCLPPCPRAHHWGHKLLFIGCTNPLNPLPSRAACHHQADDHRQHTNFAAFFRQTLADQHNECKPNGGHHWREPGIFEKPPAAQWGQHFRRSKHHQPRISLSSSKPILRRLRYIRSTIARPTPTSAAATAMMYNANV